MKNSIFNRVLLLSVFLLINQTTIFCMQKNVSNKNSYKRNVSPQIVNKTVIQEKTLVQEKRSDLAERLKCRFLKELPSMFIKEPIQNVPATYIDLLPEVAVAAFNEDTTAYNHYPIHDNCFLEWTEQ